MLNDTIVTYTICIVKIHEQQLWLMEHGTAKSAPIGGSGDDNDTHWKIE